MRKVYIETRIRVTVRVEEGINIGKVVETLGSFVDHPGVTVGGTEIIGWRILDSK